MEELDSLVNAAVLAGDDHMQRTMIQQQQPPCPPLPPQGGPPELQQPILLPQMVVHNVVHNSMHPPPLAAAAPTGNIVGGQPLQSHPTLPQLLQQAAAANAALPQPKKKSRSTTSAAQSDHHTAIAGTAVNNYSSANLYLNHPQNDAYKLKTNQYLLETSSRLDDAVSELAHYTSLLISNSSNNSNSKKMQSSALEVRTGIEHSIIPLLKIASDAMKESSKYFAPFSGTVNIHNRNDSEKKRRLLLLEVEEQNKMQQSGGGGDKKRGKKRPALLMIDEFVERSNLIDNIMMTATNNNEQPHQGEVGGLGSLLPSSSSSSKKRKAASSQTTSSSSTKKSSTTTESIIILRPANNSVYTKSEAIAICKRYRKGSRERGIAIRAMIHKKFVLSSRKTLYRLLQQDEEGKVLLENGWLGCGRPMKIDEDDVEGRMVVNSNLTFADLDRGEENRILVELNKGGGDDNEDRDDDGDNNINDDNEEAGCDSNANNNNNNNKQQSKKQRAQMKEKIPLSTKGICTASGCTNQIARRGLCIKHGMQNVDPKIISFPLPPPKDGGTVYKKSECVEIAKRYKKGSSQRRLALEAMIHRGYAKNSLKSLYRLLLNDEKGIPIPDDDWRGMGCPSVLSATEIDEVIERIKREDIRLANDDDVRKLVLDALKAKGVTDESKLKFSATTVKNYGAIFKSKLSTVYWKESKVSTNRADSLTFQLNEMRHELL